MKIAAVDLILWSCLADELDIAAFPFPPRMPNVSMYEAHAIVIRDRIEARTASTVRPRKR
jgi:hypothetical protein